MVKQGYKQTEIGVIPEDWDVVKLGQFCFITKLAGFEYSKYFNSYKDGGEIIVVRGTNITNNKLDLSDVKYIPKRTSDFLHRSKLSKGDLVFAYVGTIGPIYLINEDDRFHLGPNTAKIRIENKNVCKSYLYNYFLSENIKKEIDDRISVGAQPSLSMSKIRDFSIILPPLAEQEAIATALSDADAWIDSLEQLIAKKRLIKQGAMQELLTPREDWIKYDFNKVVWFQEGPGLRNWQFTKDGIKVINVTNLENGYLNLAKTSRHISWNEFEKMYKHFEIDEGDIVVASSGNSYGKVSVVRKQDLPLVMNTSVIRFKPSDKIGYQYLLVFLKSFLFKNQIDLLITGGAQPNFGPAHLNKIKIYSPKSLSEQERIATILSDMDAELEALEQQLGKAQQIKQGMMQELLTGRVRLV